MMSMFSIFDMYFWIHLSIIFTLLSYSLNNTVLVSSSYNFCVSRFLWVIVQFFCSVVKYKFKLLDVWLISIFFMIFFYNFVSIMPYYFSMFSQSGMILELSMTFWLMLTVFHIMKNFKGFFIHLIPMSCPMILSLFLFLIELVSLFIRPLTLSIRLLSNVLSGHLLLVLTSYLISINKLSFSFYLMLTLVEMFVSIIQAYIFCTLSILYLSELK